MHRIFITDLDGTLLRSDQTLSDYTVDVLNAAMQEEDCIVSFATARGFVSAIGVVSPVAWKYPAILYNGALL
ncbi:HAD family hydrolase [Paenibacillus sp.]|uniref:HAD family hydrolase n=1 Tax=Paenibacillus sp. TaxID=58172 RepID=UPI002D67F576|nr:HAD hydrolase family protein [Paenibacillus sp.]HZG86727.1 HAD hydrolase family protein [Paenibacillus sp.]